jgi:hypothetical protein
MIDKVKLDALSVKASALREPTDTLNQKLTQVRDELRRLNLGVRAYVDISISRTEPKVLLYWGKLGKNGEWDLFTRREGVDASLFTSSRKMRAVAAKRLPDLFEALFKTLDSELAAVKQAIATTSELLAAFEEMKRLDAEEQDGRAP